MGIGKEGIYQEAVVENQGERKINAETLLKSIRLNNKKKPAVPYVYSLAEGSNDLIGKVTYPKNNMFSRL